MLIDELKALKEKGKRLGGGKSVKVNRFSKAQLVSLAEQMLDYGSSWIQNDEVRGAMLEEDDPDAEPSTSVHECEMDLELASFVVRELLKRASPAELKQIADSMGRRPFFYFDWKEKP